MRIPGKTPLVPTPLYRRFTSFGAARFIALVVWAGGLLTVSYSPRLRGEERLPGGDIPGATVLATYSVGSRDWVEMPFPSFVTQDAKMDPKVDLTGARKVNLGTRGASAESPGCASTGVVLSSGKGVSRETKSDYERGLTRYISGDYKGALELLTRVAETDPVAEFSGRSSYYLADSHYHLGQTDEALRRFQQFVKTFPDHELLAWGEYSMGWIYMEQRDYRRALLHFQRATKRSEGRTPLAPEALFWQGEALGRSGQIEEAIASKRLFLEGYPNHQRMMEVQLSMGEYLFRLRRFGEASELFRRFVAIYPSHSLTEKAHFGLGQSLIYDQRYEEGIALLKEHLDLFPETSLRGSVFLGLVRGYLGKDEVDTALVFYEELALHRPDFEWTDHALFDIGYSYFRKGMYAKSVEIYQTLLKVHPESELKGFAYFNLGEAFYNLEAFGDALDSYRLARETEKVAFFIEELLFKMGLCFYQKRRYNKAIELWEMLRSNFPDSPRQEEVVYWIGDAFLQNRNPERAKAVFTELKENTNLYPKALNRLGLYYSQEAEWSSAIYVFSELLDRYPDHPLSIAAYSELGEAFYHRKDYAKALSYLDEMAVREGHENSDRGDFIRGRIHYKEGKFDLAIAAFSRLIKGFPQSPFVIESQYWIAWSYYRIGAYEKAIQAFSEVVQNAPSSRLTSQALLRVGDSYYQSGFYPEATSVYLQVLREFPHSPEVPEAEYGILLASEQQGIDGNFVEKAKAFLARYPTHPLGADSLSRLANHYLESHMIDDAIAAYRELVDKFSMSELADDAQFKLGQIYREREDLKSAIVEFSQVVKQYPESKYVVNAYFETAEGYFALGDYRRALEGYRRVASEFPESQLAPKAYLKAADCFERIGRKDLSEKRLLELMEIYPGTPIRYKGALRLGLILLENVRYVEAIKSLREATKSTDEQIASLAQVKIGEIYRKMGDHNKAVVEFRNAINLYPDQITHVETALFELGEIYGEQKRWADARETYLRVIEVAASEAAKAKARTILMEIDRRTGFE
jgi:TolA-binding protein